MAVFFFKEKDGTQNIMVSGAVSREPEIKETKSGKCKIRWSVRYGKKKYMDCECWEDSPCAKTAGMLEKDDTGVFCGTLRSYEYNGKTYTNIDVDTIVSGTMPTVEAPASTPQTTADAGVLDDGVTYQDILDDEDGYAIPFE